MGIEQRNAFQTHCTKPHSDENNFYHLGILKNFGILFQKATSNKLLLNPSSVS